jgi:hypothetical protein
MDGFVAGPYFSVAPLSSSKHVGEYPALTTSYRELSFQVIKEDPANGRPQVREFTNVTAAVLPVHSPLCEVLHSGLHRKEEAQQIDVEVPNARNHNLVRVLVPNLTLLGPGTLGSGVDISIVRLEKDGPVSKRS